jgi:hypothetical protein
MLATWYMSSFVNFILCTVVQKNVHPEFTILHMGHEVSKHNLEVFAVALFDCSNR